MSEETNQIIKRLDDAYAALVEARKLAVLSKHESSEEIGDAMDCIEAAFGWIPHSEREKAASSNSKEPAIWYGLDGWESLKPSVEDVVEIILDRAGGADDVEWPIIVTEFTRMDVRELAPRIVEKITEEALEILDDKFANPEEISTEPTPAMKAAAEAFAKVVVSEYVPWACEPTGKTIKVTREEAEADGLLCSLTESKKWIHGLARNAGQNSPS